MTPSPAKRWGPLAFCIALTLSPSSQAHQPGTGSRDVEVESPTISYAFYGELTGGDDLYVLHLDFDRDFALPFEILTPRREAFAEFRPHFAIVGPGLPPATADELALLPSEPPEGYGVYLERNDAAEREIIFESFSRRVFWTSGPIALPLQQGETEVWIFSPEGDAGDFVLGMGVEEDFSGFACSDLTSDWGTYAY